MGQIGLNIGVHEERSTRLKRVQDSNGNTPDSSYFDVKNFFSKTQGLNPTRNKLLLALNFLEKNVLAWKIFLP